jgi:GcrA cell cycle regulator
MNANMTLRRRDRDRAAHHELKPAVEPGTDGHRTDKAARESAKADSGTPRAGATWTSERVAQLRSCVSTGLTCSQIAGEIGVSRNAVIGKMNRLGLSRPKNMLAAEPERRRAAWRAKSDNVTRLFSQHRILMRLPPAPPTPPEAIRNGRGCSLLELAPGKCRWPINEPGTADFCFCAHPQVEGLPYCVGHARIAYKSTARSSGARV